MHVSMKQTQENSMHPRMKPTNTLTSVKSGDARYDETCANHAREELRRFLETRTQEEASKALGMHQTTISRNLRADRQPSFKIVIRLAKATGRTVDDIIGLAGTRQVELRKLAEGVAEEVARRLRDSTPPPPESTRRPSRPAPRPRKHKAKKA